MQGRPSHSQFRPEIHALLFEALASGATLLHACAYAGIPRRTVAYWRQQGELQVHPEYVDFLHHLQQAEAAGVMKRLKQVALAADEGDWRAAAWILERRYPHHYGPHQTITVSDEDPAEHLKDMSDADLDRLIARGLQERGFTVRAPGAEA